MPTLDAEPMNSHEALTVVEALLTDSRLNPLQKAVFCHTWDDKSYLEIAHSSGYELGYVKQTGSQLWKLLSRAFDERVTKHNLQVVIKKKVSVTLWPNAATISESLSRPLPHSWRAGGMVSLVDPLYPRADVMNGAPEAAADRATIQTTDDHVISPNAPASMRHPSMALELRQAQVSLIEPEAIAPRFAPKVDWGDAIDAPAFVGRTAELQLLTGWIQRDRCRLIGLFGMGGIGKTSLSVRLARQQLAEVPSLGLDGFQVIIWRSLRNAPPLTDLLTDLVHVLSDQQETCLPETLDGQLRHLLHYLRQHRCLIVLDNAETVMVPGDTGGYLPGYEGYGQLWRCLGEAEHQSVGVVTSREKPKEIAMIEGQALLVRSHQLKGLLPHEGQEIFHVKGDFHGSEHQWQTLIDHYAGNPLALKILAPVIQDLFEGDIAEFLGCLHEGTSVFGDIHDLLTQQMIRLSALERDILDWLAIARQPVSLSQLRSYFIPAIPLGRLLEALSSLERRYLIEKATLTRPERSQSHVTLQPAVMEYITEHLIDRAIDELAHVIQGSGTKLGAIAPDHVSTPCSFLRTHALIQAQTQDYVREAQTRLILQPVGDRLLALVPAATIATQLRQLLVNLREQSLQQMGYLPGNVLNLLCQIGIDLTNWDFSGLAIRNAYLREVPLHRVNFADADFTQSIFKETFSQVLCVAFSPDGTYLATGDVNHEIHIWKVADGRPLVTFHLDEGWVWSVAFSPDGRLLAGSANRTVKIWDIQTGTCVHTLRGYHDRVFSVAFNSDGQLLASGSEDHLVRIWHVKTGQLWQTLEGHTHEVRSVAFSPDRFKPYLLASGSYDGTVRLWDVRSQRCLTVLDHTNWVWSVAFSPDSQTLASGSSDRTLKLWSVATGQCLHSCDHPQQVRSVTFGSDGRSVASCCDDGTLRIWDEHTGDCMKVFTGHKSWISSLAFNPTCPILASGSEDQSVKLWDSQSGLCLKTLQGYSNGVWSVAFSPDGRQLASGSQDRVVRLWEANTGMLCQSLHGHSSWVWSVAFSPTAPLLASGSEDCTIRLWDLRQGVCCQTFSGHQDAVLTVLFSADGQRLISSSLDGAIAIWESRTGRCLNRLLGHAGGVWCAALSRDGTFLVTGSQDQTVKLWHLNTGECLQTLKGHPSWIRCVAISPDQQTLISGGADGMIHRWRSQDGTALGGLQAHDGPVLSVMFHPDGKTFVTSSTDTLIKCWDAECWDSTSTTGCSIIAGHTRWVKSVAYSPDGQVLASSSQDETIKLWGGALVSDSAALPNSHTLRIPRPYEGMVIHRAVGLTSAQISALKTLGAADHLE